MHTAENSKYAKTHEWAYLENGVVTVGISEYAQQEIGDIVFVDLPTIGTQVTAAQNCCVIESVKSASEIYAPVSGEIVAINEAVNADPALVNRAAHGEGWLFQIKASKPEEYESLLDLKAYQETLDK